MSEKDIGRMLTKFVSSAMTLPPLLRQANRRVLEVAQKRWPNWKVPGEK